MPLEQARVELEQLSAELEVLSVLPFEPVASSERPAELESEPEPPTRSGVQAQWIQLSNA